MNDIEHKDLQKNMTEEQREAFNEFIDYMAKLYLESDCSDEKAKADEKGVI